MTETSVLKCLEGCSGFIELSACALECPECGGLLDVVHPGLPRKTGGEWREFFDRRRGRGGYPGDPESGSIGSG